MVRGLAKEQIGMFTNGWFHMVVVITYALHKEGPGFEPHIPD